MKIDFLEEQMLQIGFLAQDSFSGVAALVKKIFTRTRAYGHEEGRLSYWQLIFSQSKTNGCCYRGEALPHVKWRWPRGTWFQEHLTDHLKALESAAPQVRSRRRLRRALAAS
jgi:hypothetical protein